MNKKAVAGTSAALALLVAAYAFSSWGGNYSDDPEVAAVQKARDREFADPDSMDDNQMKEAGQRLKKMAEGLSEDQKKSLWESSMPMFVKMHMQREEAKWDAFLAMSPDEQRQELDKKIDEQTAREARTAEQKKNRPKFTAEQADEFWKKMNDWTTPEQRAKFEVIMDMYNDRRAERGMDPVKFGR